MSAELARLRAELEARFGSAILPAGGAMSGEARPGFGPGVLPLERMLPGGVPRGALSLWVGTGTSGRTAAVRALVERACVEGERVAVVDAGRALDASFGATAAGPLPGLWVVRPPEGGREREGAWAAEALLRAGVFALVVLDGCLPEQAEAHRLRALARERDAALLVSLDAGEGGIMGWRADVRLEFRRQEGTGLMPGGRFRGRAWLSGERAGGREREVELVYEPADCLRPGAPAVDRRPRAR